MTLLMLMLFAANYYCTSVSCAAALVAHLCSNLLSFALKRHRLSKCRHKTWIHTAHPHTHMEVGRGRPGGGRVRSTLVSSHAAMTVCTWLWLWFWHGFGFRTRLSLACTVSVCPVLAKVVRPGSYMLALPLMSKSGQHMSHAQQAADVAMWLTRLQLSPLSQPAPQGPQQQQHSCIWSIIILEIKRQAIWIEINILSS